jgi:hypothetical protein
VATPAQVRSHRREIAALVSIAAKDLKMLFSEFSTKDAAEQALRDLLPRLIAIYGSAAATLGADWYDDLRDAAEVKGRFRAIPADLPDAGSTDALARWAAGSAKDLDSMLTLTTGGTQRRIANADRETVTGSSIADPKAQGWMRVGDGDSCEFCSMLIGRGAVYKEATVGFESHDHCGCVGVPQF